MPQAGINNRTAERRQRRRSLRKAQTDAEQLLWHHLRSNQLSELKFRRQHEVGPYIIGFYCHKAKLVVEIDGSQHYDSDGLANDGRRTAYLESQGLSVVRFTNIEVLTEIEGVLTRLLDVVQPSP